MHQDFEKVWQQQQQQQQQQYQNDTEGMRTPADRACL